MSFFEKIKRWFKKNKKYVLLCGTVILIGAGYVICNNKKILFSDWLKQTSTEGLENVYEKMRLSFCKTGTKPYGMEQISRELGERGAKEWFEKHPPNLDPNYRWTDANRWDRD